MKPTNEFYGLLEHLFDIFNAELFNAELPKCMIVITRKNKTFGYYSPKRWINNENNYTDELAINPLFFTKYPFIEILQTIVHEMCHLWQEHKGTPSQRTYHNKEWANKMESIGLMPSNTGKEGGKKTGQQMMEYPLDDGLFLSLCVNLIYDPIIKDLWFDKTKNSPVRKVEKVVFNTDSQIYLDNPEAIHLLYSIYDANGISYVDIEENNPGEDPALTSSAEESQTSKSKLKYSCQCGNNIWGKANLNINCNECNTSFEQV